MEERDSRLAVDLERPFVGGLGLGIALALPTGGREVEEGLELRRAELDGTLQGRHGFAVALLLAEHASFEGVGLGVAGVELQGLVERSQGFVFAGNSNELVGDFRQQVDSLGLVTTGGEDVGQALVGGDLLGIEGDELAEELFGLI